MKQDLYNLGVLEEVVLKCGDCGMPLVEIVKTETNSNRVDRGLNARHSQFRCQCPNCNGWSFNSKVFEGSTIIAPVKSSYKLNIIDTELINYDNHTGVILTIFGLNA